MFSLPQRGDYTLEINFGYQPHGYDDWQYDETTKEISAYCCDKLVNFHFEHEDGTEDTAFDLCEDVYLDGSETQNTGKYYLDLWKVNNDGTVSWISKQAPVGWALGHPDLINITDLFENNGAPNIEFEYGMTYEVKLAIIDPYCGWVEKKHRFAIKGDCCDDFTSADFSVTTLCFEGKVSITVSNFEEYEYLDAVHNWYILSSTNPDSGPYTLEYQTTTTGAGPITLIDDLDYGFYYTVIHRVTTYCGELCYATVVYCGENSKVNEAQSRATEIDCSILCELSAPTNLEVSENGCVLTWDAVPGAYGYLVRFYKGVGCGCVGMPPVDPIPVDTNYLVLEGDLKDACFAWEVIAICAQEKLSPPSEQKCHNSVPSLDPEWETISISPNPSNGVVNFRVKTTYDTPVTIEIHNFYGNFIKSFVLHTKANKSNELTWDGSSLAKGVYFVTFKTTGNTIQKTIIIK